MYTHMSQTTTDATDDEQTDEDFKGKTDVKDKKKIEKKPSVAFPGSNVLCIR